MDKILNLLNIHKPEFSFYTLLIFPLTPNRKRPFYCTAQQHKVASIKDILQKRYYLFCTTSQLQFRISFWFKGAVKKNKNTRQSWYVVTNKIDLNGSMINQIEEQWVCRFVWNLMYSGQICAAFKGTNSASDTHAHLVQLLYPPDQQWVAGRVLKINIICRGTARRTKRRVGREGKEKSKEKCQSALRGHPNVQGDFQLDHAVTA